MRGDRDQRAEFLAYDGRTMTQGLCDRCFSEPATHIARDRSGKRLEIGERCKRLSSDGLVFEDAAPPGGSV
jgi:hypothetical protein